MGLLKMRLNEGGYKLVRYVRKPKNVVNIGGRDYPFVQIGNQLWLAEDLLISSNSGQTEFYNQSSMQYFDANSSTLFPNGWRIPTKTDVTYIR